MTRLRKRVLVRLCAVWAMLSCAVGYPAPPSEQEVKLAFIHNIVKLVEWPVPSAPARALRFCILGQNPFGAATDVLRHKQIDGRDWEVLNVGPSTSLRECRVLFISASEADNLKRVLDGLQGSAVLTVGDSRGYAERGVIVNFYLEDDRVRFEINAHAARWAGLRLSSQLLRLARIVREPAL